MVTSNGRGSPMKIFEPQMIILQNHTTEVTWSTASKTIFFFQTTWKDGLSKKIALKYDLSCIIWKDDTSFSRNMILHLRQKMKDDPSQKKCTEIWYFLQTFWKDGLFKNLRAWKWCFLYYLERWDFFPKNMIFFSWPQSERLSFSRNTWKYDIFCVHVPALQPWHHTQLSKKIKDDPCGWSYPAKIHLKLIEVLDWRPRKSSNNFPYFHEDLYRRIHVLLSSKKKQET